MPIFGGKKENKKTKETQASQKTSTKNEKVAKRLDGANLHEVVRHPRITEKGTLLAEDSRAYVFDVAPSATKAEIAKAVEKIYKVRPTKVRTVKVPRKQVTMRGNKKGYKPGGKKAYVFLKDGDTIEFV